MSLVPFVRGEIDDLTIEARLYLDLDAPDGVAFAHGATWSATLSTGCTPPGAQVPIETPHHDLG